jgi:eukaryotic-like serine/threonine-protein kinase
MGSPGYMSPEQVRSPKTVDARTDVWALGVILFELLTRRSPFAGDTIGETFARILSDPPEPIRNLRPDVPETLAAVIAQCLERDPARRLQSVAALAPLLLPFAPREAELSVDRIRRISRGAESEGSTTGRSNTATFAAPSTGDGFGFGHPGSGSGRVPTASVWQTSSSTAPSFRRRSSRNVAIGAIAGALVLGVVGLGAHLLRGPQAGALATTSLPRSSGGAAPKDAREPPAEGRLWASRPIAIRVGRRRHTTAFDPTPT